MYKQRIEIIEIKFSMRNSNHLFKKVIFYFVNSTNKLKARTIRANKGLKINCQSNQLIINYYNTKRFEKIF